MREDFGEAGRFRPHLRIEAGVLAVEHVEQRTASHVELLAIGYQQRVRNRRLPRQVGQPLLFCVPTVPGGADILFRLTLTLAEAETRLARPARHFLDLRPVDPAIEQLPAQDDSPLHIVGAATEAIHILTDAAAPFQHNLRPEI